LLLWSIESICESQSIEGAGLTSCAVVALSAVAVQCDVVAAKEQAVLSSESCAVPALGVKRVPRNRRVG
jgi:hypothetical protein